MLIRNCLLVSDAGLHRRDVPFAGKVNRMEGSSFIAGADICGLGFCMGSLKLLHTTCASQFLTV